MRPRVYRCRKCGGVIAPRHVLCSDCLDVLPTPLRSTLLVAWEEAWASLTRPTPAPAPPGRPALVR